MRRIMVALLTLGIIGGFLFWILTQPDPLPEDTFAGLTPDLENGALVFTAAGCASCHMAEGALDGARLVLSGGQKFPSPFGTFLAPNISPDPQHGIGGWSVQDLGNAMQGGVSPEGQHYFPVFPYASYQRATPQDVVDLHAYLATLPPSAIPSEPHDVGFPFSIRRSLGGWKLLFFRGNWVMTGDLSPQETRGRYLVEALGHCGECHTPRNFLGGSVQGRWLAGGPVPGGKGRFPTSPPQN